MAWRGLVGAVQALEDRRKRTFEEEMAAREVATKEQEQQTRARLAEAEQRRVDLERSRLDMLQQQANIASAREWAEYTTPGQSVPDLPTGFEQAFPGGATRADPTSLGSRQFSMLQGAPGQNVPGLGTTTTRQFTPGQYTLGDLRPRAERRQEARDLVSDYQWGETEKRLLQAEERQGRYYDALSNQANAIARTAGRGSGADPASRLLAILPIFSASLTSLSKQLDDPDLTPETARNLTTEYNATRDMVYRALIAALNGDPTAVQGFVDELQKRLSPTDPTGAGRDKYVPKD